jgi:hypothetical protein
MSPDRWLSWADWIYFSAAAIALLATAVTVLAGIAQHRLSARISDKKDRQFAEFRVQAQHAIELTQAEADLAKAETAKVTQEAAKFHQRAEQLALEAAQANQHLEQERTNRLKLQAALTSRHLSPEHIDHMANALHGKLKEATINFGQDQEQIAFASDIANMLTRAGIRPRPIRFGLTTNQPVGLALTGTEADVSLLAGVFREAGFEASNNIQATIAVPVISVGTKPLRF